MIDRLIFVTAVFLLCASCTKDRSTERDSKIVKYVTPVFSIKEVQPGDTLEIYGKTTLHFNTQWQHPRINYTAILDNDTLQGWYSSCPIRPDHMDNRCHSLVIRPQVDTTPDPYWMWQRDMGDTVFMIHPSKTEFKYTLKYVSTDNQRNSLRLGKTEDDYLCLSWDNPNLKDLQVSHYEVFQEEWYSGELIATLGPDQTTFVDSTYVWGARKYTLRTHFVEDAIEAWEESIDQETPALTDSEIKVEELPGRKKIKLEWAKPQYRTRYRATLHIIEDVGEYMEIDLDYHTNYLIMEAPPFPTSGSVYIDYITDTYKKQGYGRLYGSYSSAAVIPTKQYYDLQPDACFAYNRANRSLYILRRDYLEHRDLSLNITNTIRQPNLHFHKNDRVVCSWDGSKIVIMKNTDWGGRDEWPRGFAILDQDMTLLANFTLPDHVGFQPLHPEPGAIGVDSARVMLAVDDNFHVFDMLSGSLLYSEKFPVSPYYCKYVISHDGKYVCQYSTRHLQVFEIGETGLVAGLAKNFTTPYKSLFDPNNSDNIYIDDDRQTQRLSIKSGAVNSSVVQGKLECIDPATNNVLYSVDRDDDTKILYLTPDDLRGDIVQLKMKKANPKLSLYGNMLLATAYSQLFYTDILTYRQ